MFPHTLLNKPLDTLLNIMQWRVILNIVFLICTIRITHGIYIPPEEQTPTPSTAPPGGGTIASVLEHPPGDATNKQKNKGITTPLMEYINDEETAYYYEYVNQTNEFNEDEYCTFTLYVSSTANKNSEGGCKMESSGDGSSNNPQVGRGTIVSAGPRLDVKLRRRLIQAEERIKVLETQLFRQSEMMAKLQNRVYGLDQTNEGTCIALRNLISFSTYLLWVL